jgi:hypothetical protein
MRLKWRSYSTDLATTLELAPMAGLFDDVTLPIPCPDCGREAEQTIGWIKDNRHFTCPCGTQITLDADALLRELAEADAAWLELKRTLEGP